MFWVLLEDMLVCSLESQSWTLSFLENGLWEDLLESFRNTIKIFDPTNHWLFVCNFAVFVSLQFVMQTGSGWPGPQYFHFLSSPGQVWSKLFINISRNFDTLRLNIFWDLFEKFLVLFNRVSIPSVIHHYKLYLVSLSTSRGYWYYWDWGIMIKMFTCLYGVWVRNEFDIC